MYNYHSILDQIEPEVENRTYLNVLANVLHTKHRYSSGVAVSYELLRSLKVSPQNWRQWAEKHGFIEFNGDARKGSCDSGRILERGWNVLIRLHKSFLGRKHILTKNDKKVKFVKEIDTPVDVPGLLSAREEFLSVVSDDKETVRRAQICADWCRYLSIIAEEGVLRQKYYRNKTKRLTAVGLSLQNCPREVRKIACAGQRYSDMENSQYSILNQLGNYPTINNYVNNKQQVRTSISEDVGISIEQTKEGLLQILFGASLKQSKEGTNALERLMGDKWYRFTSNEVVVKIVEEIRKASTEVLPYSVTSNSDYQLGKRLCYYLQEQESKILDKILEITNATSLHYDGLVHNDDVSAEEMESYVYKTTGWKIKLEQVIYG